MKIITGPIILLDCKYTLLFMSEILGDSREKNLNNIFLAS